VPQGASGQVLMAEAGEGVRAEVDVCNDAGAGAGALDHDGESELGLALAVQRAEIPKFARPKSWTTPPNTPRYPLLVFVFPV